METQSKPLLNHAGREENEFAEPFGKKNVGSKIPRRAVLGEISNRVTDSKPFVKSVRSTNVLNQKILPAKKNNTLIELQPSNLLQKTKPVSNNWEIKKIVENAEIISKLSISSKCEQLPTHIENVDKEDEENLFLVSIYVNDIYNYLRSLEDKFPIQEKYLKGGEITGRMRAMLVDWLFDVEGQFKLLQETLHRAVALVDLYMQAEQSTVSRGNLQLVGVGALFLACKYEEIYPPELSDLVFVTDSSYSKSDILNMEALILKCVSFELGRPISISFLRRYSKVAKVKPNHHTYAKYFLDLALLDYSLVHIKPSVIAAAASFIAQCVVESSEGDGCVDPGLWTPTLCHYSTYKFEDFKHVIPHLAKVIKNAPFSKLKAVHTKYSTSKNMRVSVSDSIGPHSEVLEQLLSFSKKEEV